MKVLVAMSGGVDSSVAAKLITDSGAECVGATMKLYSNDDIGLKKTHACCSLDDVSDARRIAMDLGMPYYVFNFCEGFREKIINSFIEQYLTGRTPNPCIDCNRYMKFGKLFERADALGCDMIATGHYVRREEIDGKFFLKKGLDESKDQSYVLWFLDQNSLKRLLFPLGNYRKSEVRRIAEESGFINAKKHDSQDICFVPDKKYAEAIVRFCGSEPPVGDYLDVRGRVIGKHKGIIRYTLGQHKGLAINSADKLFVVAIDPENNTVTLGEEKDLYKSTCEVEDDNFVLGEPKGSSFRCRAKVRYSHSAQPATVYKTDYGFKLVFDEPQRAMTPGQSAVLYDGDVVLGGGIITSRIY